ncbi:zinc finger CCCH domain-containing protein 37 [Capsaspora owczarzaki ATCC 30864]|uniref:zinc finger CCCH domain-containing protein 37 n=1 Tax=Capsaspora owczarzaki (strain ATCC 30864) TaxID=595528 RepID=UPI0001FE2BAA|nr:zinc finger CCCH domain-containing protein 37 [Capsaspora owczarzaki ATCC 30864]|eukprot:XP_004345270.1 zinc finger CCCH domain-containing protein 37 [Capsaspora owczarzaki ATCC 30864]
MSPASHSASPFGYYNSGSNSVGPYASSASSPMVTAASVAALAATGGSSNSSNSSSSNNANSAEASDFVLDSHKIHPCVNGHECRKVYWACSGYHGERDRRRDWNKFHYLTDLCPRVEREGTCPDRDACKYCHNMYEQLYHPHLYKFRFCKEYPVPGYCARRNFCAFAHSDDEVRTKLLKEDNFADRRDFFMYAYKTSLCPLVRKHEWSACHYAHTPNDRRRDPREKQYSPELCTQWEAKGVCERGDECPFAHGLKEQLYHTLRYKTELCSEYVARKGDSSCPRGHLCAYYHEPSERRQPSNPRSLPALLAPTSGATAAAAIPPTTVTSIVPNHHHHHFAGSQPVAGAPGAVSILLQAAAAAAASGNLQPGLLPAPDADATLDGRRVDRKERKRDKKTKKRLPEDEAGLGGMYSSMHAMSGKQAPLPNQYSVGPAGDELSQLGEYDASGVVEGLLDDNDDEETDYFDDSFSRSRSSSERGLPGVPATVVDAFGASASHMDRRRSLDPNFFSSLVVGAPVASQSLFSTATSSARLPTPTHAHQQPLAPQSFVGGRHQRLPSQPEEQPSSLGFGEVPSSLDLRVGELATMSLLVQSEMDRLQAVRDLALTTNCSALVVCCRDARQVNVLQSAVMDAFAVAGSRRAAVFHAHELNTPTDCKEQMDAFQRAVDAISTGASSTMAVFVTSVNFPRTLATIPLLLVSFEHPFGMEHLFGPPGLLPRTDGGRHAVLVHVLVSDIATELVLGDGRANGNGTVEFDALPTALASLFPSFDTTSSSSSSSGSSVSGAAGTIATVPLLGVSTVREQVRRLSSRVAEPGTHATVVLRSTRAAHNAPPLQQLSSAQLHLRSKLALLDPLDVTLDLKRVAVASLGAGGLLGVDFGATLANQSDVNGACVLAGWLDTQPQLAESGAGDSAPSWQPCSVLVRSHLSPAQAGQQLRLLHALRRADRQFSLQAAAAVRIQYESRLTPRESDPQQGAVLAVGPSSWATLADVLCGNADALIWPNAAALVTATVAAVSNAGLQALQNDALALKPAVACALCRSPFRQLDGNSRPARLADLTRGCTHVFHLDCLARATEADPAFQCFCERLWQPSVQPVVDALILSTHAGSGAAAASVPGGSVDFAATALGVSFAKDIVRRLLHLVDSLNAESHASLLGQLPASRVLFTAAGSADSAVLGRPWFDLTSATFSDDFSAEGRIMAEASDVSAAGWIAAAVLARDASLANSTGQHPTLMAQKRVKAGHLAQALLRSRELAAVDFLEQLLPSVAVCSVAQAQAHPFLWTASTTLAFLDALATFAMVHTAALQREIGRYNTHHHLHHHHALNASHHPRVRAMGASPAAFMLESLQLSVSSSSPSGDWRDLIDRSLLRWLEATGGAGSPNGSGAHHEGHGFPDSSILDLLVSIRLIRRDLVDVVALLESPTPSRNGATTAKHGGAGAASSTGNAPGELQPVPTDAWLCQQIQAWFPRLVMDGCKLVLRNADAVVHFHSLPELAHVSRFFERGCWTTAAIGETFAASSAFDSSALHRSTSRGSVRSALDAFSPTAAGSAVGAAIGVPSPAPIGGMSYASSVIGGTRQK